MNNTATTNFELNEDDLRSIESAKLPENADLRDIGNGLSVRTDVRSGAGFGIQNYAGDI